MRFVISIVAALMILGLAAFGVISAQKMLAAPSSATASDSPPATGQTAPIAARRHPVNPVSQLAQTDDAGIDPAAQGGRLQGGAHGAEGRAHHGAEVR